MKNAFYHIYPLGLIGAGEQNNLLLPAENRIDGLYSWADHIVSCGFDALYLGPLFQSLSHGYDTVDYYNVDRRLGTNEQFARFSRYLKEKGVDLYLDGVFNHVSRRFPPFADLLEKGEQSLYRNWFRDVSFQPFSCRCWEGHESLVELNLSNREVRDHIFGAVELWYREFGIAGLRLDVAYCLDRDFLGELRTFTRSLDGNFKLLGEVIHGNYRDWIEADLLDMTTNYECYKGIWSSLNDGNMFEIAHSLNRLFGEEGLYRGYDLYNFIDNHDVDRIASILQEPAHYFPAMILLFTMPGTPSIYYGSEWRIPGKKEKHSDRALRPAMSVEEHPADEAEHSAGIALRKLLAIRSSSPALKKGTYRELYKSPEQLVYLREWGNRKTLCAVNSSDKEAVITLSCGGDNGFTDLLSGERHEISGNSITLKLWPRWGSVLEADHC